MVRRLALLRAPVDIGFWSGTVCHLLQYLSSVVGLAVLAIWYRRLPLPAAARAGAGAGRSAAGPVMLLLAAAALLIGSVQATEYFDRTEFVYRTLGILLTRSLAWFALLYVIAGSIVTLDRAHERASSS